MRRQVFSLEIGLYIFNLKLRIKSNSNYISFTLNDKIFGLEKSSLLFIQIKMLPRYYRKSNLCRYKVFPKAWYLFLALFKPCEV